MAQTKVPSNPRFEGFVHANLKLDIAPVPTPVQRAEAVRYVNWKATEPLSRHGLTQLARFAAFHGLTETAPAFEALLKGDEREPDEAKRAGLVLIALAEIGDDEQRRAAQQYFHALLDRVPALTITSEMERVADAFGPKEGVAALKRWVDREIKIQNSLLEEYTRARAGGELSEQTLGRIRALEEFKAVRLPRVEAANKVREKILAAPLDARIIPLVDYYVDVLNVSTEELSWWAALRLMRMAEADAAFKPRIAGQFLKLAERYEKKHEPGFEQVYLLCRTRCLRAAVYFGHELDAETRAWLDKLEDAGVDALALRPDWEY